LLKRTREGTQLANAWIAVLAGLGGGKTSQATLGGGRVGGMGGRLESHEKH